MNYRILKKGNYYYVQEQRLIVTCATAYHEWSFVREYLFFKRKFPFQGFAEYYIESAKANCPDYEVISEY